MFKYSIINNLFVDTLPISMLYNRKKKDQIKCYIKSKD